MRYKKGLLLVLALLACSAVFGSGSASATVLCKTGPVDHACPISDIYGKGTAISSQLATGTKAVLTTSGGATYMECTGGSVNSSISNPGSAISATELSEVAYGFSGCAYPATTLSKGSGSVNWTTGTHNGSVTQSGSEVRWTVSGVNCNYTIKSPVELQGGSSASLVYNKTQVLKTGGALTCPEELKLTATFTVKSPAPLYVEKPAVSSAVLCKSQPSTHTCPAGDVYGVGTAISANSVAGVPIKFLNGGELLVECASGGFSAQVVESPGVAVNEVKHTYSGCSTTVTPISNGVGRIHWEFETDNGELALVGGETRLSIFGVTCTYAIKLGSVLGGTSPKLVYSNALAVKTAGGFLCPSELRVQAEYNVVSPTPLYVEK